MTARSNNTGERINAALGVIRVPTVANYGLAYDGSSVDAGTAMVNSSNANHLIYESVREIAMDWRSGDLSTLLNGETPYPRGGGYLYPVDWSGPSTDNVRPWNKISWALDNGAEGLLIDTGGTARAYPLVIIFDAVSEDESALTPRWIRCFVRAKSAATGSLQIACCITAWGESPLNREAIWAPDNGNLETQLWKTVSTTEETLTFDLRPNVPLAADLPRQSFRCEETGPNPVMVQAIAGVLWFGFYSTNTADYWRTFSAYELREGT